MQNVLSLSLFQPTPLRAYSENVKNYDFQAKHHLLHSEKDNIGVQPYPPPPPLCFHSVVLRKRLKEWMTPKNAGPLQKSFQLLCLLF